MHEVTAKTRLLSRSGSHEYCCLCLCGSLSILVVFQMVFSIKSLVANVALVRSNIGMDEFVSPQILFSSKGSFTTIKITLKWLFPGVSSVMTPQFGFVSEFLSHASCFEMFTKYSRTTMTKTYTLVLYTVLTLSRRQQHVLEARPCEVCSK